jgi:putative membrane protein
MMGMGFGFTGLLFMLLLWGGLIALAIWLISVLFPRTARPTFDNQDLNARQILDRRYARGEITREQYELMKQDISENTG